MTTEPKTTDGIAILAIGITHSHCDRHLPIEQHPASGARITFNVEHHTERLEGEQSRTWLRVTLQIAAAETAVLTVSVEAEALFQFSGGLPLVREEFEGFNAPAILYPYAREAVADLTRRANLIGVHLPPLNFTGTAVPVQPAAATPDQPLRS